MDIYREVTFPPLPWVSGFCRSSPLAKGKDTGEGTWRGQCQHIKEARGSSAAQPPSQLATLGSNADFHSSGSWQNWNDAFRGSSKKPE